MTHMTRSQDWRCAEATINKYERPNSTKVFGHIHLLA